MAWNDLVFSVPLLAGLAGAFHCMGMCGPFVVGYSTAPSPTAKWQLHLGYNLGRLTSYSLLGLLFGSLGKLVDLTGELATIHAVAALGGGGFMVLYALHNLGWLKALPFQFGALRLPWVGQVVQRALSGPSGRNCFALGLCSGLLPCHLLLPMEALAAASGSPLKGMATLALFGLGTLPTLLWTGSLAGWLSAQGKARLNQMVSLLMLATGLGVIALRWW